LICLQYDGLPKQAICDSNLVWRAGTRRMTQAYCDIPLTSAAKPIAKADCAG
jgi:hypothetical protein